MVALETYMAELASSIEPFEVSLTELQLAPAIFNGQESGILWLDVLETQTLRQLHNRVNDELSQRFGNTQADYDGPAYHFHMTVMLGGQTLDVYRQFYREISVPSIHLRYTVSELAMFVYNEPLGPQSDYLAYKILPIGHAQR
ncbi:hypothetical protein BH10CHL1_BH10CHL1_37000 [soil metagenome]